MLTPRDALCVGVAFPSFARSGVLGDLLTYSGDEMVLFDPS